ncbi:MAG: 50S ribosomal protein L6 [Nanobdellota archaeon]
MRQNILKEIEVPEGVEVSYNDKIITVKGPKGETSKKLFFPLIDIKIQDSKVTIGKENASKNDKKRIGTLESHIKNLVKGVSEGYTYKLKICAGHFPMNVSVAGEKIIVKNFIGEKNPRELTLKKGPQVKVEGDYVIVEGINKEVVGQIAADIESLTRITRKDRRIFQDGIYITDKNGKEI